MTPRAIEYGGHLRLTGLVLCLLLCPDISKSVRAEAEVWPSASGVVVDGIVAIVNSEPITLFEVDRAAAPFIAKAYSEGQAVESETRKIRMDVLNNLINDILIREEAKKLEIEVTPEQVDAHLDRVKSGQSWDDEDLEGAVIQGGFSSLTAYRTHVERELMKTQAVSIRVSSRIQVQPDEVMQAYAKDFGQGAQVEQRRTLHIRLKLADNATADDIGSKLQRLAAARTEILAGTLSFEEAARRISEDGSAGAGGDMGWIGKGDFDPQFEDIVFGVKPGDVSKPIQTRFGVHLIKVLEIRTKDSVSEEERDKILRQIRYRLRERDFERLYEQWVGTLRSQAYVEIRDF